MPKTLKLFSTVGIVTLISVLAGCGASTRGTAGAPERPTPTLNDSNGIVAESQILSEGHVTSLGQWTDLPDFVAVATVTGQAEIPPQGNPDTQDNYWNTLRTASITRVLWKDTNGPDVPASIEFVDEGWARTGDSSEVHPIVPDGSVRIDVGDTFVAAFVSKQTIDADRRARAAASGHASSEGAIDRSFTGPTTTFDVPDTRPDWQILGPSAKLLLDSGGQIEVAENAPDFQRPLEGMTVDEFARELLAREEQS